MDFSVLVWPLQAVVSAFCAVLWSQLQDTKKKAEKASEDLASYKVAAAEKFLTKIELKDAVEVLNKAFERHATRIDERLDKLEERILKMTEGRHG